jgi:hypothetical protein
LEKIWLAAQRINKPLYKWLGRKCLHKNTSLVFPALGIFRQRILAIYLELPKPTSKDFRGIPYLYLMRNLFSFLLFLLTCSMSSQIAHPYDYSRALARPSEGFMRQCGQAIQDFGKQDTAKQRLQLKECVRMHELYTKSAEGIPNTYRGNAEYKSALLAYFQETRDSLLPLLASLSERAFVYPPNIKTDQDLEAQQRLIFLDLVQANQISIRRFNALKESIQKFEQTFSPEYGNYVCVALENAFSLVTEAQKTGNSPPQQSFIFDIPGSWSPHGPGGPFLTFTFGKGPVEGVGQIKPKYDELIQGFKSCLSEKYTLVQKELVGGLTWHLIPKNKGWARAPMASIALEQRAGPGEMVLWIQVFP